MQRKNKAKRLRTSPHNGLIKLDLSNKKIKKISGEKYKPRDATATENDRGGLNAKHVAAFLKRYPSSVLVLPGSLEAANQSSPLKLKKYIEKNINQLTGKITCLYNLPTNLFRVIIIPTYEMIEEEKQELPLDTIMDHLKHKILSLAGTNITLIVPYNYFPLYKSNARFPINFGFTDEFEDELPPKEQFSLLEKSILLPDFNVYDNRLVAINESLKMFSYLNQQKNSCNPVLKAKKIPIIPSLRYNLEENKIICDLKGRTADISELLTQPELKNFKASYDLIELLIKGGMTRSNIHRFWSIQQIQTGKNLPKEVGDNIRKPFVQIKK